MYENGLLILSTHNLSLAHTEKVLNQAEKVYEKVLTEISDAINHGILREKLKVEPLLPLFKVR
jgi:glutamate-1-semialdehyde 2,1-aminomutase